MGLAVAFAERVGVGQQCSSENNQSWNLWISVHHSHIILKVKTQSQWSRFNVLIFVWSINDWLDWSKHINIQCPVSLFMSGQSDLYYLWFKSVQNVLILIFIFRGCSVFTNDVITWDRWGGGWKMTSDDMMNDPVYAVLSQNNSSQHLRV